MNEMRDAKTIQPSDADFVLEMLRMHGDRTVYFTGEQLKKVRRLARNFGFFDQQRMGDRYYRVSTKGRKFAIEVRRSRLAAEARDGSDL